MKTVLVFDTEDPKGMENTIAIVEHLAKEYMARTREYAHRQTFGKIEFIKVLRHFASEAIDAPESDGGSLRFAKRYADEVWKRKKDTLD